MRLSIRSRDAFHFGLVIIVHKGSVAFLGQHARVPHVKVIHGNRGKRGWILENNRTKRPLPKMQNLFVGTHPPN